MPSGQPAGPCILSVTRRIPIFRTRDAVLEGELARVSAARGGRVALGVEEAARHEEAERHLVDAVGAERVSGVFSTIPTRAPTYDPSYQVRGYVPDLPYYVHTDALPPNSPGYLFYNADEDAAEKHAAFAARYPECTDFTLDFFEWVIGLLDMLFPARWHHLPTNPGSVRTVYELVPVILCVQGGPFKVLRPLIPDYQRVMADVQAGKTPDEKMARLMTIQLFTEVYLYFVGRRGSVPLAPHIRDPAARNRRIVAFRDSNEARKIPISKLKAVRNPLLCFQVLAEFMLLRETMRGNLMRKQYAGLEVFLDHILVKSEHVGSSSALWEEIRRSQARSSGTARRAFPASAEKSVAGDVKAPGVSGPASAGSQPGSSRDSHFGSTGSVSPMNSLLSLASAVSAVRPRTTASTRSPKGVASAAPASVASAASRSLSVESLAGPIDVPVIMAGPWGQRVIAQRRAEAGSAGSGLGGGECPPASSEVLAASGASPVAPAPAASGASVSPLSSASSALPASPAPLTLVMGDGILSGPEAVWTQRALSPIPHSHAGIYAVQPYMQASDFMQAREIIKTYRPPYTPKPYGAEQEQRTLSRPAPTPTQPAPGEVLVTVSKLLADMVFGQSARKVDLSQFQARRSSAAELGGLSEAAANAVGSAEANSDSGRVGVSAGEAGGAGGMSEPEVRMDAACQAYQAHDALAADAESTAWGAPAPTSAFPICFPAPALSSLSAFPLPASVAAPPGQQPCFQFRLPEPASWLEEKPTDYLQVPSLPSQPLGADAFPGSGIAYGSYVGMGMGARVRASGEGVIGELDGLLGQLQPARKRRSATW